MPANVALSQEDERASRAAFALKSLQADLRRLVELTTGCALDMHEPDEQGVSAHVVGDHLDNAMGNQVSVGAITHHYQELVVVLRRDNVFESFNLASLIALARCANLKS